MNKKIVIGIVVFCVVLSAGIFIFMKNGKNDSQISEAPEEVLTKYFSYINEKNYEEMYNFLSDESKNKISKEDFITRNSNIYNGMDATNLNVQINGTDIVDDNNTNVRYTISMDTIAGKIEFNSSAILTKNDKSYRLNWSSKFIYPTLGETDKIRVTTKEPKRGNIIDRNNKPLASEGVVSSVGLVPGKMNADTKDADIKIIADYLEMSEEAINKSLNASYVKDDTFVALKNVSKEDYDLKNKLLQVKGIKITDAKERVYPYGEELAHLIGYVQNVTAEDIDQNAGKGYTSTSKIGKTGLEKVYEEKLRGTTGAEICIVDEANVKKETISKLDSVDGTTVKLTIDADIQKYTYEQFKDEKSATVVMNPKTGEILALVSTPSYNTNDFILGMSSKKWNELSNDTDKPMYSRYAASFVPGSSFKPVIGAIGISTEKIKADEDFGTSGNKWQKDSSWGDHYVTTLASYSKPAIIKNALIYSDNIYFAKAALKIGGETLKTELDKIGFNQKLNIGISATESQYANNKSFSSEAAIADTGYGQAEVLVNPIHMASIYSAFVNDGNMIMPYLEYKEEAVPELYVSNAFSKEAADEIKEDLIQVVEDSAGTASTAKIPGVKLAGKTGTAEIKKSKDDTSGTELGWFNAFIADENSDKQLLVVSMIEDVKNRGGSHYVIPKVKSIFERFGK